jgi:hypothetical protein
LIVIIIASSINALTFALLLRFDRCRGAVVVVVGVVRRLLSNRFLLLSNRFRLLSNRFLRLSNRFGRLDGLVDVVLSNGVGVERQIVGVLRVRQIRVSILTLFVCFLVVVVVVVIVIIIVVVVVVFRVFVVFVVARFEFESGVFAAGTNRL